MIKKYDFNDTTQLSPHFNVKEFRCKCGKEHETLLSEELVDKLEKLYDCLNCSKIIVTSGYRCADHDKNVGGSGTGQHTKGTAADICCYGQDGQPISSKIVCCKAQDIGFSGIANINDKYIYTHVDVQTGSKWYGDEVHGNSSMTDDFYMEGASCQQIARGLERDGVLTARGNTQWYDNAIRRILENEKYMGDALLQKTYTVDFLKKKRLKNNGDIPQYYVEDDHEPIIPKELFMKVQEEMARRGSQMDCKGRRRGFSSKHCFTGLIYCTECGEQFRRIHWNNRGCKSVVWRCITRLDKDGDCSARTVYENELKKAFVAALNQLITDSESYIPILQNNIASVLMMSNPDSAESIQARINELQQQIIDKASRQEDYDDAAQEVLILREQKENAMLNNTSRSETRDRIRELQDFITAQPSEITEFDESLIKHLLKKVTVFDGKLIFEFKSAVTVEVEN